MSKVWQLNKAIYFLESFNTYNNQATYAYSEPFCAGVWQNILYFTLTRYVNVLMSHVRFPMMSHHQLVELLLHPVSKSHTNMIVEKIREGLRFHKGEEEIGPTIDNRIYTPRLYTTEKFCASLSVDHFYELPSYHCRSLLFSSQRLACPHLTSIAQQLKNFLEPAMFCHLDVLIQL